jgi:insulysin
MLALS